MTILIDEVSFIREVFSYITNRDGEPYSNSTITLGELLKLSNKQPEVFNVENFRNELDENILNENIKIETGSDILYELINKGGIEKEELVEANNKIIPFEECVRRHHEMMYER